MVSLGRSPSVFTTPRTRFRQRRLRSRLSPMDLRRCVKSPLL
ncbi:hypothetical protein BN903_66 [Halorubrum sp. AJ67]|nr:hypothetical protein BN903_66 [Halorubrum sp. AJ67]